MLNCALHVVCVKRRKFFWCAETSTQLPVVSQCSSGPPCQPQSSYSCISGLCNSQNGPPAGPPNQGSPPGPPLPGNGVVGNGNGQGATQSGPPAIIGSTSDQKGKGVGGYNDQGVPNSQPAQIGSSSSTTVVPDNSDQGHNSQITASSTTTSTSSTSE